MTVFNTQEYEKCQTLLVGPYRNRKAIPTITRMQSPEGLLVEGSVCRNLMEQGFDLVPDRDNKSKYDPDAMFTSLCKYVDRQPFKPDEALWQQAKNLCYKAFCSGPKVRPNLDKEFLRKSIKGEKSSGAPLFTSKELAFESDYQRMLKWAQGKKLAEPCVAYHRVQHGSEGPKNRLVWGYPQMITIAEMAFSKPIIEYFKKNRTPMALGLHRSHLSARLVPIVNSRYVYALDFSGFDASQSPELIHHGACVLSNMLEFQSDYEKDLYWKTVNYQIHTPILMPDGNVYQTHSGQPSGSGETSNNNSPNNYTACQYAVLRLGLRPIDDARILVLGDDSIFGLDTYVSLEELAKGFSELGLKMNVQKSKVFKGGDHVHFLGHTWHYGVVTRDAHDIARHMAFPERRSKIEDPRKRIRSRVYPYMADATDAARIIFRWSKTIGSPWSKLQAAGLFDETDEIGWMRLQNLLSGEGNKRDVSVHKTAYYTILK